VIGGANLDIKAKSTTRPVAATSNPSVVTTKPGGVARNIAHNLARLDIDVGLLSVVGDDAVGESLLAATAAAGVDISACKIGLGVTGTYIAFLDEQGELITAANDMGVLQALTPELIQKHAAEIQSAKFVLADCNLHIDTLLALAALAKDKLIIEPVSVEKSQRLKILMDGTPVFLATPNLDQIEALTGSRLPPLAAQSLERMGLKNLVIHAGADGAYAYADGLLTHIAARAKTVLDVTGAGDAATAGLICGLIKGMPLVKAAELGQELAAKVLASHASTLE